jgi:L-arabinonolactonase
MQGDYDAEAAHVSRVREFIRLEPDQGLPDGSVIDAEGGLWNAAWGAGRVRRYTADGGLDREVIVDAINTTCPAFGGPALTDLYITSSRQEMDAAALAKQPSAGGVFLVAAGVTGIPDRLFRDTDN